MLISSAQALLKSHWNGQLPVDPCTLADQQGIVLIPRDDLKHDCRGMVELIGADSIPVASYNALDSVEKQRETLARLIGHCILRHLSEDTPFFKLGGVGYEVSALRRLMDAEAQAFAIHLLMPCNLVKRAVLEKGITSIDRLAKIFDVSEVALMEKLRVLKLIEA